MIKLSLLAMMFGGLAMNSGIVRNALVDVVKEERDSSIIVEVDRELDSLTKEGIKNYQKSIYNSIKYNVTSNIKFHSSFNVLNNAFVISINSKYINAVKSLPGVKSVTENRYHVFQIEEPDHPFDDPEHPDEVNDYGGKENVSAKTMNKPDDTNDGEGTVIAILDNEFFFRANTEEEAAWKHKTFSPLASDVKVRFGEEKLAETLELYPFNSATWVDDERTIRWQETIKNTPLGYEGSCYFNNKVPYYFDYGGEKTAHGLSYDDFEDFDVSSTVSYHGSHVASIAAGNDENYKGIAPKAQLVCMKVFTNYEANETDKALGFQNSTGAYDVPILHALEDCILLEVDGINMSLGSNLDDFDGDSITMKTLTRLQQAGILSSISAGNSGKESYSFAGGYGNWTTDMVETGILGGYSNSGSSTIVASGQPVKKFYQHAFKIGSGENVSFIDYEDQVKNTAYSTDYKESEVREIYKELVEKAGQTTLYWEYVPGFGTTSDFKKFNENPNEYKIAVVMRGSIDFATKYLNAKDAGAAALIIINNDPTAADFNFRCSFGETKPEIPVVLCLYRDLPYFKNNKSGSFQIIKDFSGDNARKGTLSSFTSDGATWGLDLKPDITAPGDNVRGAVPPQTKEDKDHREFATYEFLSGTSMSAPNYAGAQAVLLSKMAKEVYSKAEPSEEDFAALAAYKKTIDQRFMSTASQQLEFDVNPETKDESSRTIASPRRQGAGMVDIKRAYNTNVYFEGLDKSGNPTGSAKSVLKDIPAKGLDFSFLAHNDSNEDRVYSAKLTVMRTAIAMDNDIVPRNLNYVREVEDIDLFPLHVRYEPTYDEEAGKVVAEPIMSKGTAEIGDVYYVSRAIEYYDDPVKCLEDYEAGTTDGKYTLPVGRYVYTEEGWKDLENRPYSSTQDVILDVVDLGDITIKGKTADSDQTTISISWDMPEDEKDKIEEIFKYGCYLEGYVNFTNKSDSEDKLSMVYMGFYTGNERTYKDAPVVEPFGFEKLGENLSTIYPSELVNDIAYSLVGKDKADFGSTMVSTYIEPGKSFDNYAILESSESLTNLCKTKPGQFHLAGTDVNGKYYDDPANNIYVGSASHTNTILLQQFMLRSVSDNWYEITNEDGDLVRRDVLTDALFGGTMGKYPLYKSHVDDTYLGAGYISHRAWGEIHLFDPLTGEMFPSGRYTLKFNYELDATKEIVSKEYTIIIDSDAPVIDEISVNGDKLRIDFTDPNIATAKVGAYSQKIHRDGKGSFVEVPLYEVMISLNTSYVIHDGSNVGRLSVELQDKAFGTVCGIIKFETATIAGKAKSELLDEYYKKAKAIVDPNTGEQFYSESELSNIKKTKYVPNFYSATVAYSEGFDGSIDFYEENSVLVYYNVVNKTLVEYVPTHKITVFDYKGTPPSPASTGGCGGSVETTSITLAALAGALTLLVAFTMRKKRLGGK